MSCLLFTIVYLKRNESISVSSACKVDCEQSLIFLLNQSRSTARAGSEGRGARGEGRGARDEGRGTRGEGRGARGEGQGARGERRAAEANFPFVNGRVHFKTLF